MNMKTPCVATVLLVFLLFTMRNYEVEAQKFCVLPGTAPGECKDGPCQAFCNKYYGNKHPKGNCSGNYCLCVYPC
ncbi:hypothetical protein BT93_F0503 [Corymbia citriodora subsp. variegata]|nr:hypothetical protein BT93_F0503 [Corymbia citriodora subsp. variegata]